MVRTLISPSLLSDYDEFQRWESVGPGGRDRWGRAWLLSTLGHTLILVILGVALRPVPKGLSQETEASRPAGIAVVQRSEQTEYFEEERTEPVAETQTVTEVAEAIPATAPELALDVDAATNPASELPLPGSLSSDQLTAPISGPPRGFGLDAEAEAALIAQDRAAIAARNRHRQGEPAQLSLFGSAAAVGHRFVFVIDRSKSMGGEGLGALAASQRELSRQLQQLKENHEFQIVAYHHRTTMMGQRKMHPAQAKFIEQVPVFFAKLGAFGSTDHELALQTAISLDPDVIFFLTDGDQPELTDHQMNEIQRRTRGNVTIHCIRFGFGKEQRSDHFMKRLAERTGGDYRYVDMNARD